MTTHSQSQAGDSSQPEGSVRSKPVQSLGWIDRILGDKKVREQAREKAEKRAAQLSQFT